jgi:uncharacterized protein YbbC (DUF1343 family)
MCIYKIAGFLGWIFLSLSFEGYPSEGIKTGAEQPEKYLHLLKDKTIGLVVNHTSLAGETHLVDFLIRNHMNVGKILTPEHGFRGDASAGEKIENGTDPETGIPIFSLYGDIRKPTPEILAGLDLVVFDIQDVGCRFYTYISTLHLVMEACAENDKPLMVLDRPNPNGDYVAGPVLESGFRSFVGMHPVPVVHGCTIGELAQMINGEGWLTNSVKCELTVIPAANYSHKMNYSLPVPPSPNLPNDLAVRLYPSLCFFEATSLSVGRGTPFPFQVLGGLSPGLGNFRFTPESLPGCTVEPLHAGRICYGIDLRSLEEAPTFTLKYFLDFYRKYENEKDFLIGENWLNLLAGSDKLINQIRKGYTEKEISESWQTRLEVYKHLRKKYLLYPDFDEL